MAGRVHDLITAENFAKWAEEQPEINRRKDGTYGERCAVAQFLRASGFSCGWMGMEEWKLAPQAPLELAPAWARNVARAYDGRVTSGPALAKIARENA